MLVSDDLIVVIEKYENYIKQSYRNRCTIFSANGPLDLVVPVVKGKNPKIPINEVEISYDMNWQKQHFKAIESAYRRSPFYEYYIDDFLPFFNCRYRYLYQFNMQILHTVCNLIKIPVNIKESSAYIQPTEEGIIDMRLKLHPKSVYNHNDTTMPVYAQVFAEKWGFMPNLSILDLLFNTGPDTKKRLLKTF